MVKVLDENLNFYSLSQLEAFTGVSKQYYYLHFYFYTAAACDPIFKIAHFLERLDCVLTLTFCGKDHKFTLTS